MITNFGEEKVILYYYFKSEESFKHENITICHCFQIFYLKPKNF